MISLQRIFWNWACLAYKPHSTCPTFTVICPWLISEGVLLGRRFHFLGSQTIHFGLISSHSLLALFWGWWSPFFHWWISRTWLTAEKRRGDPWVGPVFHCEKMTSQSLGFGVPFLRTSLVWQVWCAWYL